MTVEPKMSIGDKFYSDGETWEVIRKPFWSDLTGGEWWYPSRVVGGRTIRESRVDGLAEEDNV